MTAQTRPPGGDRYCPGCGSDRQRTSRLRHRRPDLATGGRSDKPDSGNAAGALRHAVGRKRVTWGNLSAVMPKGKRQSRGPSLHSLPRHGPGSAPIDTASRFSVLRGGLTVQLSALRALFQDLTLAVQTVNTTCILAEYVEIETKGALLPSGCLSDDPPRDR